MQTLAPWTEQWQHFTAKVREQFWGDLAQHTRQSWQDLLGRLSIETRDRYLGVREYERSPDRADARNGFYKRDFVTRLGTLRVRVARTRQRAFLPAGLARLERRASGVVLLIREAFLRGLSTRAVGVVALLTEEPVSAQTVSRLTRELDQAVAQFHQAPLMDDWRYLFLDGVSLRVRCPAGRKRVQLLVAYGVRADGTRQLLGFTRSTGESQAAWEGLLHDLYRHDLERCRLQFIVTDGGAGLAAALETIYPRVAYQRCWVHKLRNLLGAARRRDYAATKTDAQTIYQAASRTKAIARQWRDAYRARHAAAPGSPRGAGVLPVSSGPLAQASDDQHDCTVLRRSPTADPTDGVFRERADHRADYLLIFNQFNLEWRQRTLRQFTQVT